jgi:hypothetical protein
MFVLVPPVASLFVFNLSLLLIFVTNPYAFALVVFGFLDSVFIATSRPIFLIRINPDNAYKAAKNFDNVYETAKTRKSLTADHNTSSKIQMSTTLSFD